MILLTKPQLKYLDKNKLHVSRRPRLLAWLIFGLCTIFFVWICLNITNSTIFLLISIFGEITFCLDALGDWEDLILNKETNKAIISKCTWTDKLCCKLLNKKSTMMELNHIRYVGVSITMGLFIVHKSGQIFTINMNGLTRKEIQTLRREINYFLNMCRIEYFDCFSVNPYDQLVITSDIEKDYINKVYNKYHSMSVSREMLYCANEMKDLKYSLQPNHSSPLLGSDKIIKNYEQKHLRKSPYTETFTYPRHIEPTTVHSYEYKSNLKTD